MLSLKIVGGETPKTGKPLCKSCKHASFVRSQTGVERTVCDTHLFNASKHIVTFPVYSCTAYHPSNVPWLNEMEDMAWIVEARKRGPAGFQQPGEGEMEIVINKPRGSKNYGSPVADEGESK
jgi:hypothetical protein